MPVAGAVSQRAERAAQPLVAAPAEARGLAFAGLHRDRGLAGVAGERVTGGVAGTAVAHLGEQLRGRDHARPLNSDRKIGAVGMLADRDRDLTLELLDLRVHGLDRGDERRARAVGGR